MLAAPDLLFSKVYYLVAIPSKFKCKNSEVCQAATAAQVLYDLQDFQLISLSHLPFATGLPDSDWQQKQALSGGFGAHVCSRDWRSDLHAPRRSHAGRVRVWLHHEVRNFVLTRAYVCVSVCVALYFLQTCVWDNRLFSRWKHFRQSICYLQRKQCFGFTLLMCE